MHFYVFFMQQTLILEGFSDGNTYDFAFSESNLSFRRLKHLFDDSVFLCFVLQKKHACMWGKFSEMRQSVTKRLLFNGY